jgi:hypothetical protein
MRDGAASRGNVEATMARAVVCDPKRRAINEPLYDVDPRTGASVEIFYADNVLAKSFGASGPGWFWWTCRRGCLPEEMPAGPFATSYGAYRDMAAHRGIDHPSSIADTDTVRTRPFLPSSKCNLSY